MIGTTIIGVLAILLNFVLSDWIQRMEIQKPEKMSSLQQVQPNQSSEEQILDTTVEIKMSFRPAGSKSPDDTLLATGLGSLIWDGSDTQLITHNHWGEVLHDTTVVTFYDVDHNALKIMLGKEFINLVTYRDAGTLVLEAPEELAGSCSLCGTKPGDSGKVKSGDLVQVVYHLTGNRAEIGLLEAKVESVGDYKGVPIFVLRSLDGLPIIAGDSGGGIWQDGHLVGNMWATITKPVASSGSILLDQDQTGPQPTDISYAAMLP